jgi:hypothetical protein
MEKKCTTVQEITSFHAFALNAAYKDSLTRYCTIFWELNVLIELKKTPRNDRSKAEKTGGAQGGNDTGNCLRKSWKFWVSHGALSEHVETKSRN